MSTDIEQITTAIAEFDRVGAGLAILQKNYGGMLYDVETPNGMALAKASRLAIRTPRYEIERIRKEAKAPLLAIGKKLDSEAARITAELLKLEEPIDQQIKNEESRLERERQAKIEAEAKRVADIQTRIDAIRALPGTTAGFDAARLLKLHDETAARVIDDSYAEFAPQAQQALSATVAALKGLHLMAVEREAEAARAAAEREELNRLRAEQVERERVERERQAEEGRRIREQQERERAEQEAAFKVERDKLAAERAEQERLAKVERDRIAEEDRQRREDTAREQARLDAQREQLRRDQEALRAPVQQAAPATTRPSDEQIAAVVAEYFHVSPAVACEWLATFGMDKAA